MRAFVADPDAALGLALCEVDEPRPGPGRAVVAVHATSLNRGEVLHVQKYRMLAAGAVPGWDVAGVIVAAATDGAGPAVGTPVFGFSPERGTWAPRVTVAVDHLAALPEGLSMSDAATLGIAACTALRALDHLGRPLAGSSVLVTGATGGMGAFAVQLAGLGGALPTAVLRSDASPEQACEMFGPTVAVECGLDPDGPPADLIVDAIGGAVLTAALQRVGNDGTVVSLGRTDDTAATLPSGWFHKNARLHGLTVTRAYAETGSAAAALATLGGLAADGRLSTNVGAILDRTQLLDGVRMLLDRKVSGKVVVRWNADGECG